VKSRDTTQGLDKLTTTAEAEGSDPDIRQIFVEEAREVLDKLARYFAIWVAEPTQSEALAESRRAFHTLKGSGRMVNAAAIGELSWALENLLNRVMEGRVAATPALVGCIEEAIAILSDMVSAFEQQQPYVDEKRLALLAGKVEQLATGGSMEDSIRREFVAGTAVESGLDDEDRQLLEIFTREAQSHLAVGRQFIAVQRAKKTFLDPPSAQLQGALHTLKGSAHMAAIEPLAELISALERFMRDMLNFQVAVDADILDLLADTIDFSEQIIFQLGAGHSRVDGQGAKQVELLARITQLRESTLGADKNSVDRLPVEPVFLQRLMVDGMQNVLDVEHILEQWQNESSFDRRIFAALACELAELQSGAQKAGCTSLETLAGRLSDCYDQLAVKQTSASDELVKTLAGAHETLLHMMDAIAAHQELVEADSAELEALATLAQLLAGDESLGYDLAQRIEEIALPADRDDEIIKLFLEEAGELLERMDQAFQRWRQSPDSHRQPDSIKRSLHTFKGGAGMAGLTVLRAISHELESLVIASENTVATGNVAPIATMWRYYDALASGVERVHKAFYAPAKTQSAPVVEKAPGEIVAVETVLGEEVSGLQPVNTGTGIDERNTDTLVPFVGASRSLDPPGALAGHQRDTSQEIVRVYASVLDRLVNLAGETSIFHSQIAQSGSEFMRTLGEMDVIIRRLNDQVRRLDIETDAQVMFCREQFESVATTEGFDPLEMDHYSQLQQLSRSLLESASDLHDLRDMLANKSRAVESLLLQQSRTHSELQEDLMSTRLVPFSGVVPRLQRIVRQVGNSLGKQVNLHLERVEGEMDRTILERIVPSLEHMIRNAVDHGIEKAGERRALGKPEAGTLTLSLDREGSDILIRLADDGRGLDVAAIRIKAVASGLIAENSVLTDHEIQQYIFTPGFTTADEVTHISGRGVGMDVVSSDIRQLGGSIAIDSQRGLGTEFIVRLPFTVSVNRALLVEAGDDLYALPLHSISGVTRIAVHDLRRFYQDPQLRFQYGGEEYEVRYLSSLLSAELCPRLDVTQGRQSPVVLIRNEGHNYAVQVDSLIGSREVVVKALGMQFSQVPGLSGATVLGDGRVVVILDLQALLTDQLLMAPALAEPRGYKEDKGGVPTVLVVDDSVTVRKVTGRFLEREGYRVITAKDGVDAMAVLQDKIPDIMLLDIEMPHMDGFEVVRLVRSTPRLQSLPIVMITSRTGDKHRERALAVGGDHYLGKPYQEDELLAVVQQLLDVEPRLDNG